MKRVPLDLLTCPACLSGQSHLQDDIQRELAGGFPAGSLLCPWRGAPGGIQIAWGWGE